LSEKGMHNYHRAQTVCGYSFPEGTDGDSCMTPMLWPDTECSGSQPPTCRL
jgi:hypothetical protein